MKHISPLLLLMPIFLSGCATPSFGPQDCSITPKPLIDAFGSEEGYRAFSAAMGRPGENHHAQIIAQATDYLSRPDTTDSGKVFFLQRRARAYSSNEQRSLAAADYKSLATLPNLKPDRRKYFEGLVETGDYPLGPRLTPLPANVIDASPLVRIPPRFPPGFLDEDNSGHCAIRFDIDASGKVINAKTEYCTHDDLAQAAKDSVLLWKYSAKRVDGVPTLREDVRTRISFNLQDECGNFFPE